jgi:hypothetical protein
LLQLKGNREFLIKLSLFAFFFGYTLLNFLPNGTGTAFLGTSVTANPSELLKVLGGSDSGNYLRGAMDLQDFNIQPSNIWIFNLWPPGQMVILAAILKIGFPPVMSMLLVLAFLWCLVATQVVSNLKSKKYRSFLIPCFLIIWFMGSPLLGWNQVEGALASDGIGSALLCLFLVYLSKFWDSVKNVGKFNPWFPGILCALTLSLLAHLRIVFLFAILFSLIVLSLNAAYRCLRKNQGFRVFKDVSLSKNPSSKMAFMMITSIFFVFLSAPFSIIKYERTGSFSWSNSDYVWAHRWMPDNYLYENNAGFIELGGGNWACEIDAKKCSKIYQTELDSGLPYSGFGTYTYEDFRNLAFKAAMNHPIDFLTNRVDLTIEAFTSKAGAPIGSRNNMYRGVIFLLLFIASLFMCLFFKHKKDYLNLAVFGILVGLFVPIVISQFETRYLMPIQALSTVYLFLNIGAPINKESTLKV